MLINERKKLASILQTTADVLDIPSHVYEDATLKYEDVGEHLAADDSELRQYSPQIYPQGSFRLGTVVHPYGRDDEYDIDLVCQLSIAKEGISQADLKAKVGRRLRAREDLEKIVKPLRRCWTLTYPGEPGAPGFHMDVLPCIPNEERMPTGILVTDTQLTKWQKSNPIKYAEWFRKRMEVVFKLRKTALAESMHVSIEEVPEWRVRTPLQRSVQILKRHRDIYFQQKPDVRPVSITLTTRRARLSKPGRHLRITDLHRSANGRIH
jgi:Second Messenger Oligonucleotide or Dinucleotide Synthetase domain